MKLLKVVAITTFLHVAAFFLCSAALSQAANVSNSAEPAQAQPAPQPTNGRGAIGVNCRADENGCRIQRISTSSPAERAGLRVGDLLLRLNPSDSASAVEQIAKNAPGTTITLPVQRGSEHIQVLVMVEDQLAIALRAAALGDPAAQESVGSIYLRGAGVPKDPAEGLKWIRKAAESGYDTAEYELGSMYAQGLSVPKDAKIAAEWYRKAADQGQRGAQYAIGWLYEHGEGVAKDDQLAFAWYRKAAEQGYPLAEYLVGQMYSEGRGVTKDDKAAAEWFRKGAEQGNALAESNLGWSYENGRGVPKDLATAIVWYKKAAEQGFEPARQRLSALHQ